MTPISELSAVNHIVGIIESSDEETNTQSTLSNGTVNDKRTRVCGRNASTGRKKEIVLKVEEASENA